MLQKKYTREIQEKIWKYFSPKQTKAFIFGSSVEKDHFNDIDIGLIGKVEEAKLALLEEEMKDSTFPYFIEFISFDTVDKEFKNHVFSGKQIWL